MRLDVAPCVTLIRVELETGLAAEAHIGQSPGTTGLGGWIMGDGTCAMVRVTWQVPFGVMRGWRLKWGDASDLGSLLAGRDVRWQRSAP